MPEYTVDCYGFSDLVITGLPQTIEQFDAAAGRVGAALEAATDNYVAHTHLTRVRRTLVEKLEAETGVARKRDGKKITESESAYMKRLEAQFGEDLFTTYRHVAEAAFAETPVNLQRMARTGGGGTIAKKYLEMVDGLVAEGKVEAFCTKYAIVADLDSLVDGDKPSEEGYRVIGGKVKSIMLERDRAEREKLKAAREAARQTIMSLAD